MWKSAHNCHSYYLLKGFENIMIEDLRLTKAWSVGAVNIVKVVAVLRQEFGVGGVEGKAVAAGLELRGATVAFPVFVARVRMRVETIVVRTLEIILSQYWNKETSP
jgi:hypothetical protein